MWVGGGTDLTGEVSASLSAQHLGRNAPLLSLLLEKMDSLRQQNGSDPNKENIVNVVKNY